MSEPIRVSAAEFKRLEQLATKIEPTRAQREISAMSAPEKSIAEEWSDIGKKGLKVAGTAVLIWWSVAGILCSLWFVHLLGASQAVDADIRHAESRSWENQLPLTHSNEREETVKPYNAAQLAHMRHDFEVRHGITP